MSWVCIAARRRQLGSLEGLFWVWRAILITVALVVPTTASSQQAPWWNTGWQYRTPINVSNAGTGLAGYQVKLKLDSSFRFDHVNSAGTDLRFIAKDSTTLLPFWIESWNPPTDATIWVKLYSIPAPGTPIHLYYGNPDTPVPAPPTDVPPTGPWTKASTPISPIGGPGSSLLAENMVYDATTQHYWMVFANFSTPGVGLMWSDTPSDPASWRWWGNIYNNPGGGGGSFAPHILQYNGIWYVFFSDWSGPVAGQHSIVAITSPNISGPYSDPATVLSPASGTWEHYRVDEPYVFQRVDGTWILIYMGDQGNVREQIGFASASNLLGPYTKFPGNPILDFGPPGAFDAGTVADPWVYYFGGVYYIGYAASPTSQSPWQTAYATTTDWQTFTKHNVMLPVSPSGWDSRNSFRGAVTRIGDAYVFPYSGSPSTGSYQIGIATQPALKDVVNNAGAVFDFYDDFGGAALASSKWLLAHGLSSQVSVSGGQVTLTGKNGNYGMLRAQSNFSIYDYMLELRGRHPQAQTANVAIETGFCIDFSDCVRLVDDFPTSTTNWSRQAKLASQGDGNWFTMVPTIDRLPHIFRIFRRNLSNGTNIAGFQVDDSVIETVNSSVPASQLPPFLMSYTTSLDSQFEVDWVRVRRYAGVDLNLAMGAEESRPVTVGLASLSLNQTTVVGGTQTTGTVTLNTAAPPGGALVSVQSSRPTVASVPAGVLVSQGNSSAAFPITTSVVSSSTTANITASYNATSKSVVLTVTPSPVSLSSLSLSPTTVQGGSNSTATVTLNRRAPAGGVVVALTSSAPNVASVPASVTVPGGRRSVSATVNTTVVSTNRNVQITATYLGTSRSRTLTVTR